MIKQVYFVCLIYNNIDVIDYDYIINIWKIKELADKIGA